MKHRLLYLIASGSIALNSQFTPIAASPLVSIGDNADIFFNGSSSLRWTSNIYRDEDNEVEDLIWTLSPGFELNVGRGLSNADLSIITRYDIVRYNQESQRDTELFHIRANGSYRSSRLDLSFSANFDESKNSSGDNNIQRDLIEYDTYGVRINGEYRLSPKFSIGSGFDYRQKEYQTFTDRFSDRETYKIPVDIFYELTPKVDLSIGYEFTNTEIEENLQVTSPVLGRLTGEYETDTHFFNVGARGNLLPKLTGFFKVGYRVRSVDDSTVQTIFLPTNTPIGAPTSTNRSDSGTVGIDANFTWSATPKVTARLDLSRDFGVGGEGQSTETTSVDLVANYSISQHFAASANLGYTLRDYSNGGREDNQYEAGLRFSYTPNQYWRLSTGYRYTENDSNDPFRSYEDHSLDLTATLRY